MKSIKHLIKKIDSSLITYKHEYHWFDTNEVIPMVIDCDSLTFQQINLIASCCKTLYCFQIKSNVDCFIFYYCKKELKEKYEKS